MQAIAKPFCKAPTTAMLISELSLRKLTLDIGSLVPELGRKPEPNLISDPIMDCYCTLLLTWYLHEARGCTSDRL
jgi:hypothetical protein